MAKARNQMIERVGRYALRSFTKGAIGPSGDVWGYVPLSNDRLVVFVGDVTGKGSAAAIVAEAVEPLFKRVVAKGRNKFDLKQLVLDMDRQLTAVMPCGVTVQVTFAYLQPARHETAPDRLTLSPKNTILFQTTATGKLASSSGTAQRIVGVVADLLGIGFFTGGYLEVAPLTVDFPVESEMVIGTDGLFDQTMGSSGLLGPWISQNLPLLSWSLTLFGQLVMRWKSSVEAARVQNDDMLMVSVRHVTADEAIIFNAREQKPHALDELVKRFSPLVWNIVKKSFPGAPRDVLEDAFQDAWLHVFAAISKWSGGLPHAWIRRVVANRIKDCIRQQKKRREKETTDDDDLLPHWQASRQIDPARLAGIRECFENKLNALDDEQRQAFYLLCDGASKEDICKQLEISLSQLNRWLQQIRSDFEACIK